jgi:hypothetical protein
MMFTDIAADLTGEQMVAKYTGDDEHPSRSEIAHLAYSFYVMRGRYEGHDLDDWLSAERELRHHYR